MKINKECLQLIKSYEGCHLTAYICPAGKPTIGYGHTGPEVKIGMTITQTIANQMLESDINRFSVGVRAFLKKNLNDNQFSALVSFAYNCGIGSFAGSTLLKYVNSGNFLAAAHEFGKWNRSGGKILPGLVARRQAEVKLFLKEVHA